MKFANALAGMPRVDFADVLKAELVQKDNPYRDAMGRFTTAEGVGSAAPHAILSSPGHKAGHEFIDEKGHVRSAHLSDADRMIEQKFYDRIDNDLQGLIEKSDFIQPLQAELDNAVAKILPPRFATCKKYIIGAGSSWPITLIWLLISRVCRRVCYVVVVSCRPHNIHIRDCSIPDSAKASPSSSTVTVATVLSNSFH